jgi:hypothetical protein
MTFDEILEELKQGKKIRRPGWAGEDYMVIHRGTLRMWGLGSWSKVFSVGTDNLFADDWEVME